MPTCAVAMAANESSIVDIIIIVDPIPLLPMMSLLARCIAIDGCRRKITFRVRFLLGNEALSQPRNLSSRWSVQVPGWYMGNARIALATDRD